jgi:hypothetical protein
LYVTGGADQAVQMSNKPALSSDARGIDLVADFFNEPGEDVLHSISMFATRAPKHFDMRDTTGNSSRGYRLEWLRKNVSSDHGRFA